LSQSRYRAPITQEFDYTQPGCDLLFRSSISFVTTQLSNEVGTSVCQLSQHGRQLLANLTYRDAGWALLSHWLQAEGIIAEIET
jgi:hypothetical protein